MRGAHRMGSGIVTLAESIEVGANRIRGQDHKRPVNIFLLPIFHRNNPVFLDKC